jgi:hypothetical protein
MLIKKSILLLTLILFSATCVSNGKVQLLDKIPAEKITGPDYRQPGSMAYSITASELKSESGCKVSYTNFKPEQSTGEKVVVMGHGFFRNEKTQRELAQHLASWGVPVVTVGFCNSRPWNGHHDKNAADMILVANAINAEQVIYSGFSAGGLSAIIAASLDSRTLAYLGLDMVDNFDKGIKAAADVKAPVFALVAESSSCNAKNNGLDVFEKIEKPSLLKVNSASHCDFEYPYDKKCAWVCGKAKPPYERVDIQETILGLTTALLRWQLGLDEQAVGWWQKGESSNYDILFSAERISSIQ